MKTDQYSSLKEKLTSKAFSSIFVLVDDNTDKFCLDIFIKKTKIGEFNKIIINRFSLPIFIIFSKNNIEKKETTKNM